MTYKSHTFIRSIPARDLFSLSGIILLPLFFINSCQAITRTKLQERIKGHVSEILTEKSKADETQTKIIGTRANEISKIINFFPHKDIPDKLGNWMEQSVIDLVELRKRELVDGDIEAKRLIGHIQDNAKYTLPKIPVDSYNEIKQKSENLSMSAMNYRKRLYSFIIDNFKNTHKLKVNVGNLSGIDFFTRLEQNYKKSDKTKGNTIDVSKSKIDSRILTFALVKKLQEQFQWEVKSDQISYTNLLSPVLFLPHFKPRTFTAVQPALQNLFNECISRKNNVTLLDYNELLIFLRESYAAHWDPGWDGKWIKSSADHEGSSSAPHNSYIVFENENDAWLVADALINKRNIDDETHSK